MRKTKTIILASTALASIWIMLAATTYAAITVNKNVSSSGSISVSANLGVYSDSGCTTPLTAISWGTLAPGQDTTRTIYIKNTGGGVSLTLTMSASAWTPQGASNYMTITWKPTSATLAPGASTAATITLSVSSSIVDVTNFSVQISIIGTSI